MKDAPSIDERGPSGQKESPTPVWYDRPAWYDIVHQRGSAREARELDTLARKHARTRFYRSRDGRGAAKPVWLEPACGTGRLLRAGASLGARVIGVDSNPNMVRYARRSLERRGLPGTVLEARMEDFALRERADLALCPHNSIRHLETDEAVLSHLRCVNASLKQGGIYVIGLGTALYGQEEDAEDVWSARRGRLRVTQVVQYLPASPRTRRERVVSVLHVESPAESRCVEMAYDLRAYSRSEWLGLIERSAMALARECDEVGEPVPEGPGYRQWVLMRREDAGE